MLIARASWRTTHAWVTSEVEGRLCLIETAALPFWGEERGYTVTTVQEGAYTFYIMHTGELPADFVTPSWAWLGGWYGG
jgi:hypothetical protein